MTVRWTDELSPAERDVPPEVTRFPVAFKRQDFGFTWQNGCVYFFLMTNNGLVGQVAFDGKTVYIGHPPVPVPDKTPTIPQIDRHELAGTTKGRWGINPDFFTAMGIRVPLNATDLRQDVLQSEIAAMVQEGAKVLEAQDVSVEGRRVVRVVLHAEDPDHVRAMKMTRASIEAGARGTLMTEADIEEMIAKAEKERALPQFRQYVFDLDPALNGAVRAREERFGGRLLQRTQNENFRQCGTAGLWVPRKSITQYFAYPDLTETRFDHPILVRTINVVDLSSGTVPKEDFVLDFAHPGIRVIQSDRNGVAARYVVASTTEDLDRILGSADVESAMHPWRSPMRIASIAIVAAGGLMLLIWFVRTRRRGTTR